MKFLAVAVAALFSLAPPAAAQPASPARLNLAEAERALIERSLEVIAARRGVDAARAQRLVASSLPPPQVSVGSSFAQFQETQRGTLRGARYLSPGQNVTVGLSVLVERGGKRELRTRVVDRQIEAAEAQVLDALRLQLFQLRRTFLAALLARANYEVALGNRGSLDRTEGLLRRQLRDGAIPEGDLLRFQASRLPLEADVTTNAQAYAAAIAAVAALLADDAAAFRPGAGEIVPAPNSTAAGRARTGTSPVAFDVLGALDVAPPLGIGRDALAEGVLSRADVVAAARVADSADANLRLAEAARSRDVSLNGTFARSRLSQDLPSVREPIDAIDQFGVSVSVPIFTRRIVEGNIGVAGAQAGQAQAQARAALLGARAEFAAAWATYEQASALLALYNGGALERAEAAYRSAEMAYLAGGRTLLDVLDALRTLNATRLAFNAARHAYLLSLVGLELATGVSGVAPRL